MEKRILYNDCFIDGCTYNDKLIIRIQLFTQLCISQDIKMMMLIVLNDLLSCTIQLTDNIISFLLLRTF